MANSIALIRGDGEEHAIELVDSGLVDTRSGLPIYRLGAAYTTEVVVTADADLTQLITVATAGTPVQGPDKSNAGGWVLKAGADNTDTVYVMFWGQTKASKGFPLNIGEIITVPVSNLNVLGFDADVNGEKIIAMKL